VKKIFRELKPVGEGGSNGIHHVSVSVEAYHDATFGILLVECAPHCSVCDAADLDNDCPPDRQLLTERSEAAAIRKAIALFDKYSAAALSKVAYHGGRTPGRAF
jgi:hypothetical protein